MQPTIQQTIIANAIKAIAPLCTLMPLRVDDVRNKSREAQMVLQRALVACYMRKVQKKKLEYIATVLDVTHASVINLLKFNEGKSNQDLRNYYICISTLISSMDGSNSTDAFIGVVKVINREYTTIFAHRTDKKLNPYITCQP